MKNTVKITFVSFLLVFGIGGSVLATSFTQGYQSTTSIALGTVVGISKDGSNQIEPATLSSDLRVVGVAADATGSIIDLQPKGSNIRVATSGDAQVLVTNSSGDIKKGDNLVISALSGIAARDSSDSTASKYIGVAQDSFSGSSSGAQQVSVQLSDGKTRTVAVGLIPANILISERQPGKNQQSKSLLSKIGEYITGREVSPLRVIASAIVLLSIFSVTGWILNSSIKGSFVSLGRNPLARVSILTNLIRVLIITLVVFAAGLTASYLILAL